LCYCVVNYKCPSECNNISEVVFIHILACLRHAGIVEPKKSANTLRNNKGSGVFSVPFRATGG
jgi:hypothetical protein